MATTTVTVGTVAVVAVANDEGGQGGADPDRSRRRLHSDGEGSVLAAFVSFFLYMILLRLAFPQMETQSPLFQVHIFVFCAMTVFGGGDK